MDATPRLPEVDVEHEERERLLEQVLGRELPRYADALRHLGD